MKEPANQGQGNSSHSLDLVLSNHPDIICNISVESGISDHDIMVSVVYTEDALPENDMSSAKSTSESALTDERIKLELKALSPKLTTQYEAKWNGLEICSRNVMDSCIPRKMTTWFSRKITTRFNRSLRRHSRVKQNLYN